MGLDVVLGSWWLGLAEAPTEGQLPLSLRNRSVMRWFWGRTSLAFELGKLNWNSLVKRALSSQLVHIERVFRAEAVLATYRGSSSVRHEITHGVHVWGWWIAWPVVCLVVNRLHGSRRRNSCVLAIEVHDCFRLWPFSPEIIRYIICLDLWDVLRSRANAD